MKIKNVEKYREELYKAIADTMLWKVEASECVWKDGHEYTDTMRQYNRVSTDEYRGYISLAQPMKIERGLFITVDEDGVCFYRDCKEYYQFMGWVDASLYKNKTSFAMALVREINDKLEMIKMTGAES